METMVWWNAEGEKVEIEKENGVYGIVERRGKGKCK